MTDINPSDVMSLFKAIAGAGPLSIILVVLLGGILFYVMFKMKSIQIEAAQKKTDEVGNAAQAGSKIENQQVEKKWEDAERQADSLRTEGKKKR
jgi:hypothetical protein